MSKKESELFYKKTFARERFIEEMARFLVENDSTVRKTARYFGISKSTVHKNLTVNLKDINFQLYNQTCSVLQKNKSERHIRGGMATKLKYLECKK